MQFHRSAINEPEVLTFGKFKGQTLQEVDDEYLIFIVENFKPSNPWQGKAVTELKNRGITRLNGDDL